jgi:hypothetical protein
MLDQELARESKRARKAITDESDITFSLSDAALPVGLIPATFVPLSLRDKFPAACMHPV